MTNGTKYFDCIVKGNQIEQLIPISTTDANVIQINLDVFSSHIRLLNRSTAEELRDGRIFTTKSAGKQNKASKSQQTELFGIPPGEGRSVSFERYSR